MGTIIFACGCSISRSMFQDETILGVFVCSKHVADKKVQKLLEKLSKEVFRLTKDESEEKTTGIYPY